MGENEGGRIGEHARFILGVMGFTSTRYHIA